MFNKNVTGTNLKQNVLHSNGSWLAGKIMLIVF